jgi:hypothetical protein
LSASGTGSDQPCVCPLFDDVSLKLGQGAEDVEDQFSATGSSINLLGETFKADVLAIQFGNPLDKVFEGSAKAI